MRSRKSFMIRAFREAMRFRKMPRKDRIQYRKRRTYAIVTSAAKGSPVYGELYKNIKEPFTPDEIPFVTRGTLISSELQWVNGDLYTGEEVAGTATPVKAGKAEKFVRIKSAGTDQPSEEFIFSKDDFNRQIAWAMLRLLPRREHKWIYLLKGGKEADICRVGTGDFAEEFFTALSDNAPFGRNHVIIDDKTPMAQIVAILNDRKPVVLTGTPYQILRLCDEKKASRLKIEPVCIVTHGELLTDEARKKITDTFNADVSNFYYTAESGVVAYECREHHLHVAESNVDVEEREDGIYITAYDSYAQPVIKYRIEDRVTLHEDCLCGDIAPWMEVKGRLFDTVRFTRGSQPVDIRMSSLEKVVSEVKEVKRYQIFVAPGNIITLRLGVKRGKDKNGVFLAVERAIREYLKTLGITGAAITMDRNDPEPDEQSGRFSTVIKEQKLKK